MKETTEYGKIHFWLTSAQTREQQQECDSVENYRGQVKLFRLHFLSNILTTAVSGIIKLPLHECKMHNFTYKFKIMS